MAVSLGLVVLAGICCRAYQHSVKKPFGNKPRIATTTTPKAQAMWLAGGGVKAGHVIGATDEIGEKAVEVAHPLKNVHTTILNLLGLDDNKLTYFHAGRFKQVSQTGESVIKEWIA